MNFSHRDYKTLWLLFGLACLMFFPALGSAGLVNTSDAYYSEAAREMLHRREFIIPHLNFSPFYDKPILTYWLIMASYVNFGVSTFAARLPSALCAVGTAMAVYVISRSFLNRRASILSTLALLTMPLFVIVGHVALTDMPLTFLTSIANLVLLLALIRGHFKYLFVAYVALGFAVLSKGPLALVLTGTCIGGFLLVRSSSITDFRNRFLSINPVAGCLVLLAVAAPWFYAAHVATAGAFTSYFFIDQNFGRLFGHLPSHLYPIWFYVPFILGGFVPSLPLLIGAPIVFKIRLRQAQMTARHQLIIAMICWFAGTLLLLLLSASKLPTYLLPLSTPIAILTGVYLDTIIRLGRRRFILWGAPVLVLGGLISLLIFPKMFDGADDLYSLAVASTSIFVFGYTAYGVLVFKSQLKKGVVILYAASFLACASLVPIAIQRIYRLGPESLEHLVNIAASSKDANIAVIEQESPKAAFYARRKVFEINGPFEFEKFLLLSDGPHFVILDDKNLALMKPFFPTRVDLVSKRGKWNLFAMEDIKQ